MITIVGLGPGDPELITRKAWQRLLEAPEVWLRTRRHPAVEAIATVTHVQSYDYLYEANHDFAAVYAAIAADVVAKAAAGDIVYAVPGDPSVAEATTSAIRRLASEWDLLVEVLPGISFLEPTFAALGEDPIQGMQVVDALNLAESYHPPGATNQGLLIVQLYSRLVAGDVKLTLINAYPDEHQVYLISGAGTTQVRLEVLPLYELDRHDLFDDLTTLWVPPIGLTSSYEDLQNIIAHLRGPQGCPWDREQTHESLRPYLLEETYEVLEALDDEDPAALQEELGDLLIQVALHVQIATEGGDFKLNDVIRNVVAKLVRRHPHVFADTEVNGVSDVTRNWEAIKQAERKQTGMPSPAHKKTLLDGLPTVLPALALAQGYVERLARVGYPLPHLTTMDERTLGAQLLQIVETAQVAGIDAESALRGICKMLQVSLKTLDEQMTAEGHSLIELPAQEQQVLWQTILQEQHLDE